MKQAEINPSGKSFLCFGSNPPVQQPVQPATLNFLIQRNQWVYVHGIVPGKHEKNCLSGMKKMICILILPCLMPNAISQ